MAYDQARNVTVLFGGFDGTTDLDDTWIYDGTTWTLASTLNKPPRRSGAALAWDSVSGTLVLFGGGTTGTCAMDDTWQWDGVSWKQINGVTSPPPRSGHAMAAFSAPGQSIVLFGGFQDISCGGPGWFGDTWAWDGTSWSALSPASSPSPRNGHAMTCDPARGRIVLFGDSQMDGLTWEWDGVNWTALAPIPFPAARAAPAMAHDAVLQRTVLFGGTATGNGALADTWLWDGTTWIQPTVAASPPARSAHALVHDAARRSMIAFGGIDQGRVPLGDTWELYFASACVSFGQACPGTQGSAVLTCATAPILGSRFTVAVQPVPQNSGVLLMLGGSKTLWGQIPLPLDLSWFGMPGCTLDVSADVVQPFPWLGTSRTWFVDVPSSVGLLGNAFHVQAFAADPGANALGAVTSNALSATVGVR